MKRISLPAPAPPPSGHDSEYGWHRRALAAEARVETLEKIIEDAPHSEHCALLPVRRELDYVVVSQRKCNCWKAAAALNAKP